MVTDYEMHKEIVTKVLSGLRKVERAMEDFDPCGEFMATNLKSHIWEAVMWAEQYEDSLE